MKTKTRGAVQMILAMTISGTVGWPVLVLGAAACDGGVLALRVRRAGHAGDLHRTRSVETGRDQPPPAGLRHSGRGRPGAQLTLLFAAYKHASIAVATVTYHVQPFMLVALGALLFGEN